MMRPYSLLRTFVFSTFLLPATSLSANDIIQDTGVANRLVAGEVLRSLSQEIPAAACHLHNQVGVEDAADLLSSGIDQLDELLDALLLGDIFWGIEAAEERRKTIVAIEALRADWAPIQAAGRRILNDHTDGAAVALVVGAADQMMDQTYRLLTILDAEYSSSAEILQRDVAFIQFSGRMAALNQRLALGACWLSANGPDREIADDLTMSADQYRNTLHALSQGLPAMGILPPQTPGIAEKLAEIGTFWTQNQQSLELIAAEKELTPLQKSTLYRQLIDERVAILDLVYLYQDHSKVH